MGITFRRTAVVKTYIEFAIPRDSNIRDFYDLVDVASREMCSLTGRSDATSNDHWCKVDANDEEIVLRVQHEERTA